MDRKKDVVRHQNYCILLLIALAITIATIAPSYAQYYIKRHPDTSKQPTTTTTITPQARPTVPLYKYQYQRQSAAPQTRSSNGRRTTTLTIPPDYLSGKSSSRASLLPPCSAQEMQMTERFLNQTEQNSEAQTRGGKTRADQRIIKDFEKIEKIMADENQRNQLMDIVSNCLIRQSAYK